MQASTCMTAHVEDERCLQCSPTSQSPAKSLETRFGDDRWLSPATTRKGALARARWRATQLARSSAPGHPKHRLSEGAPTPCRRREPAGCPSRGGSRVSGGAAPRKGGGATRRRRRSHRARKGSGGANGDAPPSGSARGFESMRDAPGAGEKDRPGNGDRSPRTSPRSSSRETTDAGG